jgi:hypothetical protein
MRGAVSRRLAIVVSLGLFNFFLVLRGLAQDSDVIADDRGRNRGTHRHPRALVHLRHFSMVHANLPILIVDVVELSFKNALCSLHNVLVTTQGCACLSDRRALLKSLAVGQALELITYHFHKLLNFSLHKETRSRRSWSQSKGSSWSPP